MIEIRLQPRNRPDGSLELHLPLSFRVFFAVLAIVVGLGMAGAPQIGLFPTIVLLVLVVGALYEERWLFEPSSGTITSRHGLLVLNKKQTWSFSDVDSVSSSFYLRGSVPGSAPPSEEETHSLGGGRRFFQRPQLKYGMILKSGEIVRIEIRRVRDSESKDYIPSKVAGILGVNVQESDM